MPADVMNNSRNKNNNNGNTDSNNTCNNNSNNIIRAQPGSWLRTPSIAHEEGASQLKYTNYSISWSNIV